jgi:hypothetical protein
MDRKAIVYSSIALVAFGAILFKEPIIKALNNSATGDTARASLGRSSISAVSPLEKVLAGLQSSSAVSESGDPLLGPDSSQPDQPGIAPAVLTFAVDRVRANRKNGKLTVKGQIQGDKVLKIEVYRDGKFLYDVFRGTSNPKKTSFSFKEDYGLGVYRIRVVGSTGGIVDKWYRFLPWVGGPVDVAPFHTRVYRVPTISEWKSY